MQQKNGKRRIVDSLLLLLLIISFACGHGYKGTRNPRSAEEVQLDKMAFDLSIDIDSLVKKTPASLSSSINGFAETSYRFSNLAQRFGANSLEARDAFDKLRYHAVQLNPIITKQAYPSLYDQWQTIWGKIETIARRLGYRLKSGE